MILECPNCSTRYMMSAASIGEQGRDVRCAKCAHEWFQEPEDKDEKTPDTSISEPAHEPEDKEENILEEDIDVEDRLKDIAEQLMQDDDDEDENTETPDLNEFTDEDEPEKIPESVKPIADEAVKEEKKKTKPRKDVPLQAQLMGYAVSLILFLIILGAGLIFKNTIVKTWPPSIAIYELAGFNVPFKGEDLVMESLNAEAIPQEDGTETLILKGRVVNLTDKPLSVPSMMAVLRGSDGEVGASWLIDSPVDEVEAGASFVFTSEYSGLPQGFGAVNLTFAPEMID